MNRGIVYTMFSLLFLVSFVSAGTLSVSITAQRIVMEAGQTNNVSAVISGGNGNYACLWQYYPAADYGALATFGTQACSAVFHGNYSDLASPNIIQVSVNDSVGDSGVGQQAVAVKPGLSLTIAASANTVQVGGSVSISNDTANESLGLQYSGDPPYQFTYILPPTVIENGNSFLFTSTGVFNITEVATDNLGVNASATVFITVVPVITTTTTVTTTSTSTISTATTTIQQLPDFISISAPYSLISVGQNVTITAKASGGVPPYSYGWFVNGVLNTSSSSSTFVFTPRTPSTYTIYATVTDHNGTKNQSNSLSIVLTAVLQAPKLTANRTLISEGQSVHFTNTTLGGTGSNVYVYSITNVTNQLGGKGGKGGGGGGGGGGSCYIGSSNQFLQINYNNEGSIGGWGHRTSQDLLNTYAFGELPNNQQNSWAQGAFQNSDYSNNNYAWGNNNGWNNNWNNNNNEWSSNNVPFNLTGNTVTFETPGTYNVSLGVTDISGEANHSSIVQITVTQPLQITSFNANNSTINSGQSVKFTNSTTGGTGSNVYSYTESNSVGVIQKGNVLKFNNTGSYIVTLTATDVSGEVASANTAITVIPPGCTDHNNGGVVSITGSNKKQTVQITDQSGVQITGSSDNVTINMPGSNCNIWVSVTGSSNKLAVYNGTISLTLTGSSSAATLHNTVISQQSITGSSNKITGAILNGKSFTITGSSNLAESAYVENLTSLQLTGSSTQINVTMLTSETMATTITGSSNIFHIVGGTISLAITGSSNYFYYHGTTITKQTITGSGNKVISD